MLLSQFTKIFRDPVGCNRLLLFSTRTTAVLSVPASLIDDIELNRTTAEDTQLLESHGMVVESHEIERQEMAKYIDELNLLNKTFRSLVVVNLNCNLACSYCFEGNRKGNYYLGEDTARDLVRFIGTVLTGKKEILLTFYGGEPLLSMDTIVRVSEDTSSLAAEKGIHSCFSAITNGTLLTRPAAERLKTAGLRSARVTLDGPPNTHDRSRPFRSGSGSFDTIIRNLQECSDLIDIEVSGNYTSGNYREFPALLDLLCASGLGPDRISSINFYPAFNEDKRFSPDFHDGCSSPNEPWVAEASLFLRDRVLSYGFRTDEVRPVACMIERTDHLVVNYDGGLYQCPGLLGRTGFRSGTLADGLTAAQAVGMWKNPECLSCPYLPLCFGGCRYLKLVRVGTMNGIDCRKDYFERAIEGLVLQDVKRAAIH